MQKYDKEAIISALKQRAYSDGHHLGILLRLFYTTKAILCLLTNSVRDMRRHEYNYLVVSCFGGGESYVPGEPTEYYWDQFSVSMGIFKNWYCHLDTVST